MLNGLWGLKNKIRKIAVKLGIKNYLLPVYDFINKSKAAKRIKQYSPSNTLYGVNTEKRKFDITVSFTTYPARIKNAIYVADAMLRQTIKPDRVILVLASDEYSSKDDLPEEYKQLEKRGLSIVITDNFKPHNKYRYAMSHYTDSMIVTVDDDVLYPENLIEMLFNSYTKYPNAVSTMRAHKILFHGKMLLPYNDWGFESTYTSQPVFDLIATGVGGVLYPPGCMSAKYKLLFDDTVIKATCLENDDIWLKIIELLCNIPVVLVSQKPPDVLLVPGSQKTSLQSRNVGNSQNDKIIHDVIRYLGINDDEFYAKVYETKRNM